MEGGGGGREGGRGELSSSKLIRRRGHQIEIMIHAVLSAAISSQVSQRGLTRDEISPHLRGKRKGRKERERQIDR